MKNMPLQAATSLTDKDWYAESELIPLSALQHLIFCERQCALIHNEQLWAENRLTAEGRHLHEKADSGDAETRGPIRIARSLPVRSLKLGLVGRADVVEFHYGGDKLTAVIPIEYKRGHAKFDDSDRVQLCAQALCLEEMLGISVPTGGIYYATPRRRADVVFDEGLRRTTEETIKRLHELLESGVTPRVQRQPKCDSCSLLALCLPTVTGARTSAARWSARAINDSLAASPSGGIE
jgi:CRISPR-associated exonuclease Cas4